MNRVILPDVSYYQYRWDASITSIESYIDFAKMRTLSPGVILRLGQGTFQDKAFETSWKNAGAAGLNRGVYWFYDPRLDPKRQAENLVHFLGDRIPEMEVWADIERLVLSGKEVHGYDNPHNWYDFMERVKALRPDLKLGVYTGYYYWKERFMGPVPLYWQQYPLWIASYGYVEPKIPAPWTTWKYWQFTDGGDGESYGVRSSRIDLNQYNGDLVQYNSDYGLTEIPVETGPEIEILFKKENQVKYTSTVITASLRGRSGPGQGFDTVTSAPHYVAGTVLTGTELKDISAQEAWMKVEDSRYPEVWVAYKFNGQYLSSVPVEEPVSSPSTITNADVQVVVDTDAKSIVLNLSSQMENYTVKVNQA